jgi:hypothetical protein
MEIPRITANGLKYMNLQEKKFISILNEFDNKYYEVLKEEIEEIRNDYEESLLMPEDYITITEELKKYL